MHKARPKVCALRTFPGSETLITLILHIKSKMVEVTAAAIDHFTWRRASESGDPYIPGQGCPT